MSILCKIFGHKMRCVGTDVGGESYCVRCTHVEPAIQWTRAAPPMPKCKLAREDDCVAIPTKPLMDATKQLLADSDVDSICGRFNNVDANYGDFPPWTKWPEDKAPRD